MKNIDYLVEHGFLYVYDDFEEAVFKFASKNEKTTCTVKFKGKPPYEVEHSTRIATDALLGGKRISEEEYLKY